MTTKSRSLDLSLLLATLFITSHAFAYCAPSGVVSAYEPCHCGGAQAYVYRVSCQGVGSGCDPLGGGNVYCTTQCSQQNAASCTAGHAPTKDLSARLAGDLKFRESTGSACPSPDAFRRWLSGRLHNELDR